MRRTLGGLWHLPVLKALGFFYRFSLNIWVAFPLYILESKLVISHTARIVLQETKKFQDRLSVVEKKRLGKLS